MTTQNIRIKSPDCSTTSTLEGVLNIRKSPGPSSFAIVNAVKHILNVKKAGHIGTLDPEAEGILPICLNGSTKIIQFLTNLSKSYRATMIMGIETDSQDATGKILSENDPSQVTEEMIQDVFRRFKGTIQQIPPMYSAKKKKGVPLYKLARKGITVERNPVSIHIDAINFLTKKGPKVTFDVHCSKGTYIRTLCHDIGRELGCGAHMLHLVRTQIGMFTLSNAISLEDLEKDFANGKFSDNVLPVNQVLDFLPEVTVKNQYSRAVANGMALLKDFFVFLPTQIQPGVQVRLVNENHSLLAIAESLTSPESFKNLQPDEIAFKLKKVFAH